MPSIRSLAVASAAILVLTACSGGGASGSEVEQRSSAPANRGEDVNAEQSTLRRELHLRPLSPGDECPRTPGGRRAPRVAITLGDGPAYPVLGMSAPPPRPAGVASLRDDIRRGGWYWHKTLWAVDKRYRGPLLIRGARIDRTGPVRFGIGDVEVGDYQVLSELGMPAEQQVRWRYGASSTLVRGPGCYAFQVDGTNFSDVIVFAATRQARRQSAVRNNHLQVNPTSSAWHGQFPPLNPDVAQAVGVGTRPARQPRRSVR
jgi:hypothetical protein